MCWQVTSLRYSRIISFTRNLSDVTKWIPIQRQIFIWGTLWTRQLSGICWMEMVSTMCAWAIIVRTSTIAHFFVLKSMLKCLYIWRSRILISNAVRYKIDQWCMNIIQTSSLVAKTRYGISANIAVIFQIQMRTFLLYFTSFVFKHNHIFSSKSHKTWLIQIAS